LFSNADKEHEEFQLLSIVPWSMFENTSPQICPVSYMFFTIAFSWSCRAKLAASQASSVSQKSVSS